MYEVVETLGTTLCLLFDFIAAIPSYTFRITALFLVPSPSVAASIRKFIATVM